MNTDSKCADPSADASAVEAVRSGDRDRYQELVERHADKVFAIAWCRLGDRDLAEEATQMAFISAYRRLSLLGEAGKFGSWIGAIVRNAAINLGLRRRGEIQKRQRWALEQDATDAGPTEEPATPRETLRETLEALPPIHRECLVLFYLENRSVTEAAARLGVSESAFKVRLHRARSVLREALEARLESGLDQLRAPSRITQAVMLALPASPSGLLGAGSLLAGVAKLLPFSAILIFLQILGTIPGLLFAHWLGKRDLENFRDPKGFRSRLYRRFVRGMLVFVGATVLVFQVASAGLGPQRFAMIVGSLLFIQGLDHARRLSWIRHPHYRASVFGIFLITIPLLGIGFFHWNLGVLLLGQSAFFLVMAWAIPRTPLNMDHSLFARAANNLFPTENPESTLPPTRPVSEPDLKRFAQFLGDGLHIEDWRRRRTGIELRLARAVTNILASTVPFYWGPSSRLMLGWDGAIQASLGEADRDQLSRIHHGPLPAALELELRVVQAVQRSRHAFLSGATAEAKRLLGSQPDAAVFRVAPAQSRAMRIRVWMLRGAAVLIPLLSLPHFLKSSPSAQHLPEVQLNEADVRAFLEQLTPGNPSHSAALSQWEFGGATGEILPPPVWLPETALQHIRSRWIGGLISNTPTSGPIDAHLIGAFGSTPFIRAAGRGFFDPEILRSIRMDPDSLRKVLPTLNPDAHNALFGLQAIPFHEQPHTALLTRELADRVRFLDRSGCLDLIDLSEIVPQLVASQIRGPEPILGRCTIPDPQAVQGLFLTRWGEFLSETRDALYLLSVTKALNRIDREACIAGILRLHRGKGLFLTERRESAPHVQGTATETWCAFESLQILGALDRVPDLDRWQFRPLFTGFVQDSSGTKARSWHSIEAWLLQEEFRRQRIPRP